MISHHQHHHHTKGKEVSCLKYSSNVDSAAVSNVSFSYDGTLLALACKDERVIRIVDPRAGKVVLESEQGAVGRNLRVAWCCSSSSGSGGGSFEPLVSASNSGTRELHLWDVRKLGVPLHKRSIDDGAGQLFLAWDEGLGTLFVAGKGDTLIRGYEVVNLSELGEAESTSSSSTDENGTPAVMLDKSMEHGMGSQEPYAGFCMLPKRACDVRNIEVCTRCECVAVLLRMKLPH